MNSKEIVAYKISKLKEEFCRLKGGGLVSGSNHFIEVQVMPK